MEIEKMFKDVAEEFDEHVLGKILPEIATAFLILNKNASVLGMNGKDVPEKNRRMLIRKKAESLAYTVEYFIKAQADILTGDLYAPLVSKDTLNQGGSNSLDKVERHTE